mmetsp:Transcript_20253/g.77746  ORF Transcript_20253/g.77746 Transcript_20253/m.77746 type:complete len:209 (-) Transcript_20253:567-1193(-)
MGSRMSAGGLRLLFRVASTEHPSGSAWPLHCFRREWHQVVRRHCLGCAPANARRHDGAAPQLRRQSRRMDFQHRAVFQPAVLVLNDLADPTRLARGRVHAPAQVSAARVAVLSWSDPTCQRLRVGHPQARRSSLHEGSRNRRWQRPAGKACAELQAGRNRRSANSRVPRLSNGSGCAGGERPIGHSRIRDAGRPVPADVRGRSPVKAA